MSDEEYEEYVKNDTL